MIGRSQATPGSDTASPRSRNRARGSAPSPESRVTFDPVRILAPGRALGEGESRRFEVRVHGILRPAFAVSWHGRVYAYLNTCRHQAQPLDFGDGQFFDEAYDALVCCHHGARYAPDTGVCVDGPCMGRRLTMLVLEQREDGVWCTGPASDEPAPGPD